MISYIWKSQIRERNTLLGHGLPDFILKNKVSLFTPIPAAEVSWRLLPEDYKEKLLEGL
jgi:hypothetical protein